MASALANITNIIVLMFENRSFDHLLGAMPGASGVLDPSGNVYPGLFNTMNPLDPPSDPSGSNPASYPTSIVPRLGNELNPDNESAVFSGDDFNHDFSDGMLCDLYGPGTTGIIAGQPQNAPATTYPPTNSGFLSAPGNNTGTSTIPGVMSYFAWGSMQVFHKLAQNFVACDAWHCDMPGHTAPNRAFMHCATTGQLGIDDDDDVNWPNHPGPWVDSLTIFEQIQNNGQTWKMYWPGSNCDTDWLNTTVFSQQYDPSQPTAPNVTQVPIANLFSDLANGNLPFYSFIMCWNDYCPDIDTSMHPNSIVESAENLLACVYNALQASNYWSNTLLIVNFDENGGMYDHKTVPAANPPDASAPVSTWPPNGGEYSFDFSVLGPRTPVLLISPWLQAGICSNPFQNTSILRFLQDLLTPSQPGSLSLTQRDLNAPSIAPVFDYANFGLTEMRTDCPSTIPLYEGTAATPVITEAQITGDTDPTYEPNCPPAPHLVKITKRYLAGLPGHPDSGKPITRIFSTVGELRAYAKARRDAALAAIRKGAVC